MAQRKSIRVHVVEHSTSGRNIIMRYRDPTNPDRFIQRSTGTRDKREAKRRARDWEAEVNAGRWAPPSRLAWEEFRERYEENHLPSLSKKSTNAASTAFNALERLCPPRRLADLTTGRLVDFASKLRAEGKSERTIESYLKQIRAALGWARDVGMIEAVPKVKMPGRAKGSKVMKGRPVTTEEFERMLSRAGDVVGEPSAASWKRLLTGLWWSGLRLSEALNLYWDRRDRLFVDLAHKRPLLRIPAELEKGNQDRLLPVAPEFAAFLLATTDQERTGKVFPLRGVVAIRPQGGGRGGSGPVGDVDWASKIITRIGKAAGVVVDRRKKRERATGKLREAVKFASAHDLRRSFGERWAVRVMPQVLKELMRHESIETTLKYYVGRNAETTAETLWAAMPAEFGCCGMHSEVGPTRQ
jgi:integrase